MPLNYFSDLKDAYATYICINWKSIDDEDIKDIVNSTHLDIYLYTVNDPAIAQHYENLLVDGVISDYHF